MTIPSMDGAHLTQKKKPVRLLEIEADIREMDKEGLRIKIDELNGILSVGEPVPIVFPDEPYITYFGVPEATSENNEYNFMHQGQITIICPDPYKYGPELTATFPSDYTNVRYYGEVPTHPSFRLTALSKQTFAMIQNTETDKYIAIGQPATASEIPVDRQTLILHDDCSTLTGWNVANTIDNGVVSGDMKVENGYFTINTVGTPIDPQGWQGPSIKRNIGTALQNFRMDALVTLLNIPENRTDDMLGMLEIYLLDANNDTVAKIGIEDVWRDLSQVQGKFQLGTQTNRYDYYRKPDSLTKWNNFQGILRIHRDGDRIRPYFALINSDGKHTWVSGDYVYTDKQNEYQNPITQIQVGMRMYSGTNYGAMRLKDIKFWRYNDTTPEEPKYLVGAGDELTFDNKKGEVLLNGEYYPDLDFGSDFFTLNQGDNNLIVHPSGAYSVDLAYSNKHH